jgi:ribonucleoside-diphosphate reductase alpha chain
MSGTNKAARPESLTGTTHKMKTGCGNVYITLNRGEDGMPFEMFISAAKSGVCMSTQAETIGRLISHMARCGLDLRPLINELKGIWCQQHDGNKNKALSCADAIAQVLMLELQGE